MSVTIVSVTAPKDGYDISVRLDGSVEYKKYYRVVCSAGGTEAIAAITNDTSLTPQLGTGLGVTLTGFAPPLLREKIIRPLGTESEKLFVLECVYGNDKKDAEDKGKSGKAPWELPWSYDYGAVMVERAAIQDTANNLIVNSAGDLFDPTIMMSLTHPTITIKCNVKTTEYNIPNLILSHTMTLNSESTTINGKSYAADSLRLNKLGASMAWHSEQGESGLIQTPYYQVNLEIESVGLYLTPSQTSWDTRVLNVGYRVKDNDGNLVRYIDEQGKEPAHPVFLVEDVLTHANNGKYSATPTYKDFILYKSIAWSGLPLNPPA